MDPAHLACPGKLISRLLCYFQPLPVLLETALAQNGLRRGTTLCREGGHCCVKVCMAYTDSPGLAARAGQRAPTAQGPGCRSPAHPAPAHDTHWCGQRVCAWTERTETRAEKHLELTFGACPLGCQQHQPQHRNGASCAFVLGDIVRWSLSRCL